MRGTNKTVRCIFCNTRVPDGGPATEPICPDCRAKGRQWKADPEPQPGFDPQLFPVDADEAWAEEPEDVRSGATRRLSSGVIGMTLILIVWAALAGLSFVNRSAPYALITCGTILALVGAGWLYAAAIQDGITITIVGSINPMVSVILLLVQFVVVPVFSLVYLFLNFSNAWRPVLLEFVGGAMLATGIALLERVG